VAGLDPVTSAEIDRLINDLSKKLGVTSVVVTGVTSVVVTHEMDSAFSVGDRMAMLERGRMLMVDTREAFEQLRDHPADQLDGFDDRQLTIRQFLRGDGDAEGPITRRKAATNYAEDLLGETEPILGDTPAVEPTRSPK
jgi:ABC-type transporter Mla maintaining outer membrane lipid asymmetry ATPase subunit MlaF